MTDLGQVGVISDPHANPAALLAVLADARGHGIRQMVCLGDLVGYNAQPRQVLGLLRASGIPCVRGNHDLMALDQVDPSSCNPLGRRAIEWTQQVLSPEDRSFLASLPDTLRPAPYVLAAHSTPGDPVIRLQDPDQFRSEREAIRRLDPAIRICLTGHTHFQEVWTVSAGGAVSRRRGPSVPLDPGDFHFVNPGSIGWPRDGDYRAAYAVLDLGRDRVEFRRVAWDPRAVCRANREAGLQPVPGTGARSWVRVAGAARGLAARMRRVIR
jgi:predicted phosphodiesterase